MHRRIRLILLALLLMASATLGIRLLTSSKTVLSAAKTPHVPRYIFIFLADGAGITHLEVSRMYSQRFPEEKGGRVISDKIMREGFLGLITTHSADSLITDSAAAATAMAAGCKAKNRAVGICADGSVPKTVLELAQEKGWRIGLATNSTIYDATPAAFASHVDSRRLFSSIVDQYLRLEPDLLLGGGRDHFLPEDQPGGQRKDQKDVITLFQKKGYRYASTKNELLEAKGPRVLGLFSLGPMSLEKDRDPKTEPSIYDMTHAALRILQRDLTRGFAILIENEHIDSAAHSSDTLSLILDFRELDRAVGLAYEFYKSHPEETLILVTSDHETGGLILRSRKTLRSLLGSQLSDLLGHESAKDAEVYWSTTGHTSQPVFVGALGVGAERFRGYQDNTDFAKHLLALLQAKPVD